MWATEASRPEGTRWHRTRFGPVNLRYYLAQPAPTQWVAVGLLETPLGPRLVTGNGSSPRRAIIDLHVRAARYLTATVAP